MDNNQKQMKQSDVLREKANTFGVIIVFIDIILAISNMYIFSLFSTNGTSRGTVFLVSFIITAFEIFSVNMFISAKRESYRTQADILDVLTDIRDGKKKQEETKTE